jgi:sec-independent protein translocase protein TatA
MTPLFAFLGLESPIHWIMLAMIGILLFGNRLPEVGRSLAKGIIEFKRGLHGLEDEITSVTASRPEAPALEPPRPPQRVQATAPKFDDKDTPPAIV